MNKTSRWAAIIGIVCGAELVAVAVIGGAGIAAFISLEAAAVAGIIGGAAILATLHRRRRISSSSQPSSGAVLARESESLVK